MSFSVDLNVSTLNWIKLTLSSVRAAGRVSPRIVFTFEARTLQQQRQARIVQLDVVVSFVSSQNEVLGMGGLRDSGRHVNSFGTTLSLVVPVTHNAIRFVNEHAQGHEIQLALQFNGTAFARDDKPEQAWEGLPVIEAGKWFFTPFQEANLGVNIPRSSWVKDVLEPIGFGKYILFEMPIPEVPDQKRWEKALAHLNSADAQYALGDDPGVFHNCRAAFEALKGFPKNVFATVEDDEKRTAVDTLLREAQQFFHSGRHVSKAGPQEGLFPVDHRDAEFALVLARAFLTYIAKLGVRT